MFAGCVQCLWRPERERIEIEESTDPIGDQIGRCAQLVLQHHDHAVTADNTDERIDLVGVSAHLFEVPHVVPARLRPLVLEAERLFEGRDWLVSAPSEIP